MSLTQMAQIAQIKEIGLLAKKRVWVVSVYTDLLIERIYGKRGSTNYTNSHELKELGFGW